MLILLSTVLVSKRGHVAVLLYPVWRGPSLSGGGEGVPRRPGRPALSQPPHWLFRWPWGFSASLRLRHCLGKPKSTTAPRSKDRCRIWTTVYTFGARTPPGASSQTPCEGRSSARAGCRAERSLFCGLNKRSYASTEVWRAAGGVQPPTHTRRPSPRRSLRARGDGKPPASPPPGCGAGTRFWDAAGLGSV